MSKALYLDLISDGQTVDELLAHPVQHGDRRNVENLRSLLHLAHLLSKLVDPCTRSLTRPREERRYGLCGQG